MQVFRLCLAVACLLVWEWPARAADTPPGQVERVPPEQAMAILGSPVAAPDGKTIGRLVDVLVDAAGTPQAGVIDVGGFMGVGARKIAVHWSVLHFAPANPKQPITLDLTLDQIKAAPEYGNPKKPAPVVLPAKAPEPAPPVPASAAAAASGSETNAGETTGIGTTGIETTGIKTTGIRPEPGSCRCVALRCGGAGPRQRRGCRRPGDKRQRHYATAERRRPPRRRSRLAVSPLPVSQVAMGRVAVRRVAVRQAGLGRVGLRRAAWTGCPHECQWAECEWAECQQAAHRWADYQWAEWQRSGWQRYDRRRAGRQRCGHRRSGRRRADRQRAEPEADQPRKIRQDRNSACPVTGPFRCAEPAPSIC